MSQRILFGPQRPVTNLSGVATNSDLPAGPIAVISAGWQENEEFTDDVAEIVRRPLHNLRLYHRADEVFADDPKLHETYRERQEALIGLQRLYRTRLRQLIIAARQLQQSEADADLLKQERRHAIAQLKTLDRHHLRRVEAIHASYADAISAAESEALAGHTEEIGRELADYETVLIAGGNVVVLMNRLRLFGMAELLSEKHIIAWSAGAMVLGAHIVLFHDRMPQRRRDPEFLSAGTGIIPGFVFLPDAKHRLRGNDHARVDLLRRRLLPANGVTLDSGAMLRFSDSSLCEAEEAKRLSEGSGLVRVRKP